MTASSAKSTCINSNKISKECSENLSSVVAVCAAASFSVSVCDVDYSQLVTRNHATLIEVEAVPSPPRKNEWYVCRM